MADDSGQLGAVVIPGTGTLTAVYVCPANSKADVDINIANSSDVVTDIKLAHIKNDVVGNVAAEDYLIGGTAAGLPTSSLVNNMAPIPFTAIEMTAGDTLAVESSVNDLAAIVHGIQRTVS